MGMRNFLVLVVVVSSGCLVPLDLGGDGGLDADAGMTGSDASCESPHDAGPGIDWSEAPCVLPDPEGRLEGFSEVLLPGCRQPIQVWNAAAAPFAADIVSDSVGTRISANWPPGMYVIVAGSTTEAPMVTFEVYETQKLDAGVVRTYEERIDDCQLAVTAHDRLLCARPGQVTVFDPSGAVRTRFAGDEVAVAGDEIWSIGANGIELRLDGPNGPELAGALVDARLNAQGPHNFGETRPGSSLRGTTTELIEYTWDGGTIASQSWPLALSGSGFVYREGEQFWNDALCKCTSGVCEQCDYAGVSSLAGFGPGRLWATMHVADPHQWWRLRWKMLELMRPLSFPSRLVRTPPLAISGAYLPRPQFELPLFLLEGATRETVALVNRGRFTHFRHMKEPVRAITNEVILTEVDQFSVRFTPNALTP